jgi:N-methylhydantoinase A/oxoprolinase/acetone carboxylase beta subunit
MDVIAYEQTAAVEVYADVRFHGQSHELSVRVHRPTLEHIRQQFLAAYQERYGEAPAKREMEIVTLRARRIGHATEFALPLISPAPLGKAIANSHVTEADGTSVSAPVMTRAELLSHGQTEGPALLIDPEATCFVPRGWQVTARENGAVIAERKEAM